MQGTKSIVAHKLPRMAKEVVLVAALLLIAGIMMAHLSVLSTYPPVFIDEPWYANAAWNWLRTGSNTDPMHEGIQTNVHWGFLANLPLVVSFAVGGLGLFQARLVSWLLGIVLILAIGLVGRSQYGTAAGVLAALLLSLSPSFTQASHYVRADIMLAALVVGAYHLATVGLDRGKWWAHLLAGILLGVSPDVHENGVIFAVALAAVYVATYGKTVLRRPGTWLFVAGGLLGATYYLAVHVFPDPAGFLVSMRMTLKGSHQLPLLSLSPMIKSVIQEIGRYHFYDNNLDFAVIGASFMYLLVRRSWAERRLMVFVGMTFVGFVLLAGNKHDTYAILFSPFFLLMVAETFVSLLEPGQRLAPQRIFVLTLLVLLLLNSGVHFARPILASRNYDYYAITDHIKTVIPQGARVLGLPQWWLGLSEYDYCSTLGLTYYHFYYDYGLTQGLEAIQPDVVIVDSGLRGLLVDEGYFPPGPGFAIYRLPRLEFNDFLARQGQKVLGFSNPWHGTFEVYAID